ncbi:MAG TPA: methyltransferase [Holophaga sp.]|nr:methyltransferase [Holophaga sp.]
MTASTFKGWTRPGPVPPGGPEPEEGETLDYICGHYRIYQYRRGHRFSTDDILAAWYGTSWCPRAGRIADLGSGIGSVAVSMAWRCPGARIHTVEAQAISARLARKTMAYNGLLDRVTIHEGDLRDPSVLEGEAPFDLVTGTPPYWPLGTKVEAAHPQAIPARLEVRGEIGDYAKAAARILAPGGIFATVFPLDQVPRAEKAYREAGLLLMRRQDVIFKDGDPYGLGLFAGCRREDLPEGFAEAAGFPAKAPDITIRRRDGSVDPTIAMVRLCMGFPPGLAVPA